MEKKRRRGKERRRGRGREEEEKRRGKEGQKGMELYRILKFGMVFHAIVWLLFCPKPRVC